jgi:hypothetical protein
MEAYGVPGFATFAELLASGVAFEGVWICTRTDTHVPLILEVGGGTREKGRGRGREEGRGSTRRQT